MPYTINGKGKIENIPSADENTLDEMTLQKKAFENELEIFNPDFVIIAQDIQGQLDNKLNDRDTAIIYINAKYGDEVLNNKTATNHGRSLREYFNLPR